MRAELPAGVLVGLGQSTVVLQTMTTGPDGRWTFSGAVVGQFYEVLFAKSAYSFNPPSLIFPINQVTQDMGDVFGTKGNSIDASDFFVTQHYNDFLSRTPDSSGLAFWTNNIEACLFSLPCRAVKRVDTSAAFFLSIEFQETGYLVERIYKASYGDAIFTSTFPSTHMISAPVVRINEFLPDLREIGQGVVVNQGNWQEQLESNKQAFVAEFVQRSKFTTAFPSTMTAAEFVNRLNANAGNPLSSQEANQLISDLSRPRDDARSGAPDYCPAPEPGQR